MSATFKTEIDRAFVLSVEQLKAINALLLERIGKTDLEFDCSDSIKLTYDDLKNALEYINPKTRKIINLTIHSRSADILKEATIGFRTDILHGVSIDLRGSEQVVSRLKSDVLEIISGTFVWYSPLARPAGFLGFMVAYVVVMLFLSMVSFYGWLRDKHLVGRNTMQAYEALLAGLLVIVVLCSCVLLFLTFQRRVFPRGTFLIGQGKLRHEHMEKVRWCIIIAFVVSLIASAVVGIPLALW